MRLGQYVKNTRRAIVLFGALWLALAAAPASTSAWSGPCGAIGPGFNGILENHANTRGGKVKIEY